MPGEITPTVAGPADVPTVVADLHAAFDEDPVQRWVFPAPADRARYGDRFFAIHADTLVGHGLIWQVPGGAAIWAPPGRWAVGPLDSARLGLSTIRGIRGRSLLVTRGLLGLEARHPREPHVYLASVGVTSAARGRGLGSALLRAGLAHVDRLGLPAYLESSNPRNVALYERHGFAITRRVRLPRGPAVDCMWRPARAQAA